MSKPPTPEQRDEWCKAAGTSDGWLERFAALAHAAGHEQGARRHALEIAAIVEQWYDGSRDPTNALQRIDDLCSVPIRAFDPAPEPEPRR